METTRDYGNFDKHILNYKQLILSLSKYQLITELVLNNFDKVCQIKGVNEERLTPYDIDNDEKKTLDNLLTSVRENKKQYEIMLKRTHFNFMIMYAAINKTIDECVELQKTLKSQACDIVQKDIKQDECFTIIEIDGNKEKVMNIITMFNVIDKYDKEIDTHWSDF